MEITEKAALEGFIAGLHIEYQAVFVPTPQPADRVTHPQLHWMIHLTSGKQTMKVEYSEGCAHVYGYQQFHKTKYDHRRHDRRIRQTCETGELYKFFTHSDTPYETGKKQPQPLLINVLYCLAQDASVMNSRCYEEWASDYGYDEDSRKGEKIYRQCLEQTKNLERVLGRMTLEKLQELYQDY